MILHDRGIVWKVRVGVVVEIEILKKTILLALSPESLCGCSNSNPPTPPLLNLLSLSSIPLTTSFSLLFFSLSITIIVILGTPSVSLLSQPLRWKPPKNESIGPGVLKASSNAPK